MLRSYAGGANVPTTLPLRQLPYQTKDERPSVGQVGQQNNIDVYPVHNKMDLFGNRLETHGHYLPELPEHQAKLNILNQQFPAIKSEPASGERVSFARNLKGRLFCINP